MTTTTEQMHDELTLRIPDPRKSSAATLHAIALEQFAEGVFGRTVQAMDAFDIHPTVAVGAIRDAEVLMASARTFYAHVIRTPTDNRDSAVAAWLLATRRYEGYLGRWEQAQDAKKKGELDRNAFGRGRAWVLFLAMTGGRQPCQDEA